MSTDRKMVIVVGLAMIVLDFFGIKMILDYPQYPTENLLFGGILLCSSLSTTVASWYIWKRNMVWK